MSNEKNNRLDDLFKKRLEDPVDMTGYKEEDWDALEHMLDKHKKHRGIVYLLPYISSVAALLLLFLGWWNLRPQVIRHNHQNKLQAVNTHQSNADANGRTRVPPHQNQTPSNSGSYAANPGVSKGSKNGNPLIHLSATGRGQVNLNKNEVKNITNTNADEALIAEILVPVLGPEQITAPSINPISLQNIHDYGKNDTHIAKNNNIQVKSPEAFHPQYALTVLAAPDANGVGSFQQSKVGTNVGLLFSAGVFKRITISTGALYSVKPYTMGFGNYHTSYQFSQAPINVTADCRMLDIPIDVDYLLYNKHQNKISIGTGLSSYIMLQENYTFNYADPYLTDPANFKVPNSSGYFFGILNLNATYQHQLNSKVGISVQPYLKLPLTNLGYSQVRLQTTGVAIGLSWNLNSLGK